VFFFCGPLCHYLIVAEGTAPTHFVLLLFSVSEFRRSVIVLWVPVPQDQLGKSPVVIKRVKCDSQFLLTAVVDFYAAHAYCLISIISLTLVPCIEASFKTLPMLT